MVPQIKRPQRKLPQRDEGYLIRSVDYGEDHRILSFLTRQRGRLDAIALGAKKSLKRFGPALDFLNHLQLEFEVNSKGGLHRLLRVEWLGSHPAIRNDFDRTWAALEWLKLLSLVLKEEGPNPGLFEILDRHLAALGQNSPLAVDLAFRFQLLQSLGYSLELSRCVRCHGRPNAPATFVAADGGLVCGSCHVPQASEVRSHFFTVQWWEDFAAMEPQKNVLDEALAYYLAIPKRGEKTTRNHSQGFRVVGRKVGGLIKKRTVKK
jgi:DNA repair protein RecO (recombination protein O)